MKQKVLVEFGKRVREERVRQSFSQEELAKKANFHRTYIGMIERAEKNVTLLNIQKIALALGVDVSLLFEENH